LVAITAEAGGPKIIEKHFPTVGTLAALIMRPL